MPTSNSSLSSLVISPGTLVPAFASATLGYYINVPLATTEIVLTAQSTDTAAVINIFGFPIAHNSPLPIGVDSGINDFTLHVVSSDGIHTTDYSIVVNVADIPVPPTVPFVAALTVSQSSSGRTLTFTDTSNYTTNTQGVTTGSITSRHVQINDATGAPLANLNLGSALSGTYTITGDQVLISELILNTGTYTATTKYRSNNFYLNGLVNKSKGGCGCCNNKSLCSDTAKAMIADKSSAFLFAYGFDVNADTAIKAADTLILT